MARPKTNQDQWTVGLQMKHAKEIAQLKTTLSQQLIKDMVCLYEEGDTKDVHMTCEGGCVSCHAVILAASSPALYKQVVVQPSTTNRLRGIPASMLRMYIRSLYVGGEIDDIVLKLSKILNLNETGTDSEEIDLIVTPAEEERESNMEPTCKIASDLLNLLDSGEASDLVVYVGQEEFKVHKNILRQRSEFFSAMLDGSWAESESNHITLQGVSADTVRLVLQHVYGGYSDSSAGSLLELVAAADMYGLSGLKENCALMILAKKCHYFHKPCPGCVAGVPDVLPILYSYGLTDLLQRAVQWCVKYMLRVWPTKTFASLPSEIHDLCVSAAQNHVNALKVIKMILDVKQLITGLPVVQWSHVVRDLGEKVKDSCVKCIQEELPRILSENRCHVINCDTSVWSLNILESVFIKAIQTLPYNKACEVYLTLHAHKSYIENKKICDWNEDFCAFLSNLEVEARKFLVQNCNQVYEKPEWSQLSKDLQQSIRAESCYISLKEKSPIKRGKVTKTEIRKPAEPKVCSRTTTTKSSQKKMVKKVASQETESGTNSNSSHSVSKEAADSGHLGLQVNVNDVDISEMGACAIENDGDIELKNSNVDIPLEGEEMFLNEEDNPSNLSNLMFEHLTFHVELIPNIEFTYSES